MTKSCLKCLKTIDLSLGEEINYIFDEIGRQLNLQGMYSECYGITLDEHMDDGGNQLGLCMACLQQMVTDYDLVLKTNAGINITAPEELILNPEQQNKEDSKKPAPYKCDDCGKEFLQAVSLTYHSRMHSTTKETPDKKTRKPAPYVCTECGKEFLNVRSLQYHTRMHTKHGKLKVKMEEDDQQQQEDEFDEHLSVEDEEEEEEVRKTIEMESKKYICNICGEGFYSTYTLRGHSRTEHNPEKEYKCDQCSFTCFYNSRLIIHKMEEHEGKVAPYKCKLCWKGYASLNVLRTHMIFHGERIHKCIVPFCDAKFYTRTTLLRHGAQVHKGVDFSVAPKIDRRKQPRAQQKAANKKKYGKLLQNTTAASSSSTSSSSTNSFEGNFEFIKTEVVDVDVDADCFIVE